jgi:Transposase.
VPARALFDYSVRPQTRREHRSLVRGHADWRTFGEAEQAAAGGWLVGMALEHERPTLLLAELRRELRSRRIERPAIDRLERLVA